MDKIKHIKSIKIENFKCFDSFQADNFGQYNIILGDNNVGKTSFLESMLFEQNISQSILNLQGILDIKDMLPLGKQNVIFEINPFNFFLNKFSKIPYIKFKVEYYDIESVDISLEVVKTEYLSEEDRKSSTKFLNSSIVEREMLKVIFDDSRVEYRSFKIERNVESYINNIPYVFSKAYYSDELVSLYSENFTNSRDKKQLLIKYLKPLIENIIDIELTVNFIDNFPIVGIWLNNKESLLPLPMFGDGTVRLFRMIVEITIYKDKYLCIDEIDTGIHFSKYKDFSRIVLSTANDNNVQLFISTHNEEFLKSFKEVLEETEFQSFQNDTKCFSLKKLPKGDIKAYRYDFEEFEFAIEQENELR